MISTIIFMVLFVGVFYVLLSLPKIKRVKEKVEKKVTLSELKFLKACPSQLELFEELFGNFIVATEELCERYKDDFDFYWAAQNLLSTKQWQVFLYSSYRGNQNHKAFWEAFNSLR